MARKRSSKRCAAALAGWLAIPAALMGGTFGRVAPIGGQASDLAIDEARGVLYVANFTANRVEVMSLQDGSIQTSINVASQPSALSVSPDGRHLVIGHYGNFTAPGASSNAVTVIDLNTRSRQTFATRAPVLGLAFGADGRALIVTPVAFELFDPVSGSFDLIDTVSNVTASLLPAQGTPAPPAIVAASVAASGDGRRVFGMTDTFVFRYEVNTKSIRVQNYISDPALGPRSLSVSRDGSYFMAGWVLHNADGSNFSQLTDIQGSLDFGANAVDSERNLIYTQYARLSLGPIVSQKTILEIRDADNLRLRERILLPETLSGKTVFNADKTILYAASASGVSILPVGALDRAQRVAATEEDIFIKGNFCDRRVASYEAGIISPSGIATDFALTSDTPGVRVTPAAGVTPATVRITVDPSYFQNLKGTATATIALRSTGAVNETRSIRVTLNNREPDQRGTVLNSPGLLVDLLADPGRDRFYVLRQDTNEILVHDANNYGLLRRLRTANTPTQMAITFDRRYLLCGHENAQIVTVYDLETLEQQAPVVMPRGHYPRSVAASGKAILAGVRSGGVTLIDRIDIASRTATLLPSLGIFSNQLNTIATLTASPNGSKILIAQGNGDVMLYDANADTFTVSRKIADKLSGAYAASSFDQFVIGSQLLNSSLVPARTFESGANTRTFGFAFIDQTGYRVSSEIPVATTTTGTPVTITIGGANPFPTTAPVSTAAPPLPAGVIQRLDLSAGQGLRATRLAEAPYQGSEQFPFTRTVAPLYSRNAIALLTVSGVTIIPWEYDASVAIPVISRVANAADGSANVATGGLITIAGSNLSPTNVASRELPLPTALGESCLTVNGLPTPVLFVSPTQINAQIPFNVEGNTTMVLRTPGGVSDNYNLVVRPNAPAVFRGTGERSETPLVVRTANNEVATLSNPVHRGDTVTIYLTGMGRTLPEVESGVPGPGNPPASAVSQPEVTIGGFPINVTFAGLAPGQVGVYQINAQVPKGVPLGVQLPLTVQQSSGSASVDVRVVD